MNPIIFIVLGGISGTILEQSARHQVLRKAREVARGKPIINIGCGKYNFGDVNVDVAPRNVPNFILGNAYNLWQFRDKQFGAAIISHVAEHLEYPDLALQEAQRVADHVFVLTPTPLNFFAWVHPDHKRIYFGRKSIGINPIFNILLIGSIVGFMLLNKK